MARSGFVDFSASNGTATAFQDYTPTNGTLSFANCLSPPGTFQVHINPQPAGSGPKTIWLLLTKSPSDPESAALPAEAQIIINLPPPPKLAISPNPNGTVQISWVTDGTDLILEKSATLPATQWTEIESFSGRPGGQVISRTDAASGRAGFYRLRRPQ